jgi:hypothetical protein
MVGLELGPPVVLSVPSGGSSIYTQPVVGNLILTLGWRI